MSDKPTIRGMIRKVLARTIRWAVIDEPGRNDTRRQTQAIKWYKHAGSKSATVLPYGYETWAPVGTSAIMWAIGGDPDNRAHMPTSREERVKAEAIGEVVIFNPITKAKVHFKANGNLEIDSPTGSVVVTAADLVAQLTGTALIIAPGGMTVQGNLAVTGNLTATGTSQITGNVIFDGTVKFNNTFTDSNGIEHTTHEHRVLFTTGPGDTEVPQAGP